MSKEITKAYILQQIQDKFKLRDLEPEIFRFLETVYPVYNIEPHLTSFVAKGSTVSVTSTGGKPFFVVPSEERWRIHRYNVIFMTGAFKVAGLIIGRPNLTDYIYVDLTKNQTVSYALNLPIPLIAQPGETVYLYVDDYTTTGNLRLLADVEVEEIR